MAHGFGHWSKFLSVAQGKGANDAHVLPSFSLKDMIKRNDPSGNAADNETYAKVVKA